MQEKSYIQKFWTLDIIGVTEVLLLFFVLYRGCIVNLFSHQLRSKFQMSVSVKKNNRYTLDVSVSVRRRVLLTSYILNYILLKSYHLVAQR